METIKKHPAPHVVAGTHYNLARFRELYNWINAIQLDSCKNAMQPFGYGLVAYDNPKTDFQMLLAGHQLQLIRCFAVTKNGSILCVYEGVNGPFTFDTSQLEKDGVYHIMIAVDNDRRTPIGLPSTTEIPLREPFSIPAYHWDIFLEGTKESKSFSNAISIGKLKKAGIQIELSTKSCLSTLKHVGALPGFYQKFLDYQKTFADFQQSLIQIGQTTNEELDLDRSNLRRITLQLGNFIAINNWIFEIGPEATPFQLFTFCKSFANVLYFHFNALLRRTELVELIRQNVEAFITGRAFSPQAFKDAMHQMVAATYQHDNLCENIETIDQFIAIVYQDGFALLGQKTKIHPLGKSADLDIRNPVQKEDKKSKRSFF